MRVLLDITYARRAPVSGTGVYVERLGTALAELDGVEPIAVANPRRRPAAGGGIGSLSNALADLWWTQVQLPRLARRTGAELIHHPLPAHCRAGRVPQVVTVHDLAFEALPDHFDRRFRAYARLTHGAAARRAAAVVCVSEATAAEVRARWGVVPARIVVAPHGPGQELSRRPRRSPTHFLYVGDDEPRKNLGVLLAAYRHYRETAPEPLDLVLAGSAVRFGAGVSSITAPSPARLADLHAASAALVHPALHEGFGLTLLEAMTMGTPVIAVHTAAAHEVCGEAAEYVGANDPQSLAQALAKVGRDPDRQRELRHRGLERASRFSWAASAQQHLDAYSCALRR